MASGSDASARSWTLTSRCAALKAPLPVKAVAVMERLKHWSVLYSRFEHRRMHIYLAREGFHLDRRRMFQLVSRATLQAPKKRPRRLVAASRSWSMPAAGANQVWVYGVVFDACANGQALKCLVIRDERRHFRRW